MKTDVDATRFVPPPPHSIEETGLSQRTLGDLALKILYFQDHLSGYEIAEQMAVSHYDIVHDVLTFLRADKLCEIKGTRGATEAGYVYGITEKGRRVGRDMVERNSYVGPAPITLEAYCDAISQQPLSQVEITEKGMREALNHLILNERTLNQLGTAVNSSSPMFLFGAPGNGKSATAIGICKMVQAYTMYIPYAIDVGGQIITVFDDANHMLAECPDDKLEVDQRWAYIHRPAIVTGGEMTLEATDLKYDLTNKYYEAPLQMKANGGVLMIDDFGRQLVRPDDLLNRWMLPLENQVDYLTLHTGRKIEIPFDLQLVLATNLEPTELVDEAFLRRLHHKIEFNNPTPKEYALILRDVCAERNVPFSMDGLSHLLAEHYVKKDRPKRGCHPRDIINHLCDIARYKRIAPTLSPELIDEACASYFV